MNPEICLFRSLREAKVGYEGLGDGVGFRKGKKGVLGIWNFTKTKKKNYSFTCTASPSETIFP